MNKFNSQQKIGDIVAEFPKAADVFKEYRIDYCCGGNRPLKDAIEEQGLNETEILNKLNNLYNEYASHNNFMDKNWQEAHLSELVDHILNKHHAYLWSELPKISELTTRILRVHGFSHTELLRVHKLFNELKTELESHLSKEEASQYPAIKKYENSNDSSDLAEAINVIKELEEEHNRAGDILKELRKVTNNYQVPADGCQTYHLTYSKLQELEDDVFQHIHLENNILFPRLLRLKNY